MLLRAGGGEAVARLVLRAYPPAACMLNPHSQYTPLHAALDGGVLPPLGAALWCCELEMFNTTKTAYWAPPNFALEKTSRQQKE